MERSGRWRHTSSRYMRSGERSSEVGTERSKPSLAGRRGGGARVAVVGLVIAEWSDD
ncbi:MAG: hypothetical protein LW714_05570 [Oxalobacteraceae bacterium]|nr:hypothetical protein [Oxalobacteraceae bacterium]